jgi:hypothetical protein
MKDLGNSLRSVLRSKPRHMAITARCCFLPWSLFYTHPSDNEELCNTGENWAPQGFWGYQHIVSHSPDKHGLYSALHPAIAGPTVIVNADDRLLKPQDEKDESKRIASIIAQHFSDVEKLGGSIGLRRTRRSELAKLFRDGRTNMEPILYFFCHGRGPSRNGEANVGPSILRMPDGDISGIDLEDWANGMPLPRHPLIFFNACQGGQMTTLFYETFASELLKQEAAGIIGAQIDIPMVFAVEYGHRMLKQFVAKGQGPVRLGKVFRKVVRSFLDKHNNPLGLAYSLYRGVDCFIDRPPANRRN